MGRFVMSEELKEELYELISNGQIPGDELKKRINADPEITAYYQEIKQLHDELFREPINRPDQDYWNTMTQSIMEEVNKKKERRSYYRPVLLAAAFVAVFMSGYLLSSINSQQEINHVKLSDNSEQDFQKFIHKSTVLLTMFVNMDRDESELLPLNIYYGNDLLKSINEFQNQYSKDSELMALLDEMERIILMIQSLKDKPETSVKSVQNGIERVDIINRLKEIKI
ncbi:MAG: hypothetical protein KDD94_03985 [Calditrichaeota bacterium]|nr:hypothetical protein [Calditrichota bacterium]